MLRIAQRTLLAALVVACSETPSGPEDPASPIPSVSGIVRSSATGLPVAGAEVRIDAVSATTGEDGRFALSPLESGPATIRCSVAGFVTFEASIEVPAGELRRDIALTRLELFEFGEFALHVPATVARVRAILLALGGPDTRGFASDSAFGAPVPAVEAALHALGADFRGLAAEKGLAVLGTSRAALPNGPESDALLRDALDQAAALSGRSELPEVPLLVYGMSGGAPEASGLTARSPDRVAALFLKVPAGVELLADGPVLGVPTYLVLAELDTFVDNAGLEAAFLANRAAGALWALAMESGVIHFSLTPAQRALTIGWMRSVLDRRLETEESAGLAPIEESAGWLGEPGTGEVAPWAVFTGDRSSASWFPSREAGATWAEFVGAQSASVPLRIRASLGPRVQSIYIHQGDRAILDALVTVNGVSIPESGIGSGNYSRELLSPLPAGARIDLEVSAGGHTAHAVGFVPETPAIVSPVQSAVYSFADTVTLSWTSVSDADRYEVRAYNFPEDWFRDGWENWWSTPGTERELKIAAADIGAPEPIGISLYAVNEGSFGVQVEPGSYVSVLSADALVGITLVDDGDFYDLEASIEGFDPAWGDLSGHRYAGLLRLELDPAGTPGIGGSYVQLRVIDPAGSSILTGGDASGAGTISSYFSPVDSTLVLELAGDQFHLDLFPQGIPPAGDPLPAVLEGTFFTGGHITGGFTARRRS